MARKISDNARAGLKHPSGECLACSQSMLETKLASSWALPFVDVLYRIGSAHRHVLGSCERLQTEPTPWLVHNPA